MANNTEDLILGTLAADTFSLGAHWIYSPEEITTAKLDWTGLNKPLAQWHGDKQKGDFTHYGDQIVCLYEYIKQNNEFDASKYMSTWKIFMETYKGYKDGATIDTVKNLEGNQSVPCGSTSHDLSVVGRITPLLLVSNDQETFLKNVKLFVSSTHNNEEVLESADFFAKVLWSVNAGTSIKESITNANEGYSQRLQNYVKEGLENKDETIKAINEFGSTCSTNGAFQGTIYLLNNFGDNFENAMIENAKAGGDSSARGMIVAMIMTASFGKEIIPNVWISQMKYAI